MKGERERPLTPAGCFQDVITFAILIFLGCFLFANAAHCQVKIPCIKAEKDRRGRWQIVKTDKTVDCVMYTVDEFRKVVDRLVQLEHYKTKVEPACELQKKQYKQLDLNWQRSEQNWKKQVSLYERMMNYNQKEAEIWRDAFYKLKKQKVPKRSWLESPWLWFGVGVVATVAVVVGSVAILNALRPSMSGQKSSLVVDSLFLGVRYRSKRVPSGLVFNSQCCAMHTLYQTK